MNTPPANRLVVEGECLAKIRALPEAALLKGQRECTALIEDASLSPGAVELAVAIREAINETLDARYAR